MAISNDILSVLKKRIEKATSFKIGKTGQSLADRFKQEYADIYSNIDWLTKSTNKKTIDDLEVEYIAYCLKNFTNCDNEQEGGGDMGNSTSYILYVVWK